MQPTLVLSAPHPGILYINGRFAGEISAGEPLLRPIGSRGAVYLDYRPLSSACSAMARKLVFSGGEPMAESAESVENLSIVLWPGGTVEIELTPEPRAAGPLHFSLGPHAFTLDSAGCSLLCNGRPLARLPAGAQLPEHRVLAGGSLLLGSCEGGRYLAAFDAAFQRQTGFLHALQIDVEADGRIRAIADRGDLVGHATLENWQLTPDGLMLVSSEPAWTHGAPRWPRTPAETARAAVEALLAGLDGEAEGYLSPALRGRQQGDELRRLCDLCVEMKYAPPDSRPCVGLLQLEGSRMARVRPLYYRTSAAGGPQGPWQIEEWEIG